MVNRANRKNRNGPPRKERTIILLAVEGGNKTEKTYFTELNRLQNEYRIVFADGNNTDAVKVVADAVASIEKKGIDFSRGDIVYAVLDTDFGKEKKIREARKQARENNIGLLLSNPCFEVWLLLHFRYSTRGYHSNNAVVAELENRWPGYRKSIESFEYIIDRIDIAIENAEKLTKHHDSLDSNTETEERNPSTDVYKLFEIIKREGGGVEDNK